MLPKNVLYYGKDEPLPERVELRAGPLQLFSTKRAICAPSNWASTRSYAGYTLPSAIATGARYCQYSPMFRWTSAMTHSVSATM
jgi:hypothetical protein